jgi:starch synthase
MKPVSITYTAPNRSHHYPYARAMHAVGALHAFVTGVSRFNAGARVEELKGRLMRHDFLQNAYLIARRIGAPDRVAGELAAMSQRRLDAKSFEWASNSSVFIYYRGCGQETTRRLHRERSETLCVMEEVNCHIEWQTGILAEECRRIGISGVLPSQAYRDKLVEAYNEADLILCPSRFVAKSFQTKGFSPTKLLVNNFGLSAPTNAPSKAAAKDAFRLLYVGQMHFRKGLRYALEAFRKLRHPNKELVLVGPITGPTGFEFKQLPANVRYRGVLRGEDLRKAYESADAFVLPTLEEGLALVQGEALSFGLPLITTENSGGEDLITHGVEGFILPAADVEALHDAFRRLADDYELRLAMGEAAFKQAREFGGWDDCARKLATALERNQNARLAEVQKSN